MAARWSRVILKTKNSKAFTIVEMIIVIVVVAILSTLAVITFNSIRQDSRDAARQGSVTIISEALEKYYERNGEYPSVASVVNNNSANTGEAIATKLSIPVSSLATPRMPDTATNALTSDITPSDDYITYIAHSAENNLGCQNDVNGGCDEFTLSYNEESTNDTKVVESRRRSREVAQRPELEVNTAGADSISAAWTSVLGASSYELQRSLSPAMTTPTVTTHSSLSTTASGLTPQTEYFFRVRASLPSGASEWSDVQSATTGGVGTPNGTITISATMSGTNARGTTGGGTCPTGSTIERQIRHQVNGGAWQAWVTGAQRDVAATEGHQYTFQAQARCVSGGTNGPWQLSTTASVIRPVSEPSGLTISATMSGTNARGTAGGGSCANGTTIERQIRYAGSNTAAVGTYVAYTTGTPRDAPANQGWRYTFQQRARCVGTNSSSDWIASSTAAVTRGIDTLSIPNMSTSTSGNITTWAVSAATCPTGTTIQYRGTQAANHVPAHSSNWGVQTGNTLGWHTLDGHTYTVTAQVRCMTVHTTGVWSAARSTTYKRTVSPPTNEGNVTFSISFTPNRLSRTITYPPPTCRSGARPVYRWNSYMSNHAWAATGAAGWRYGTASTYQNLWSPVEYDDPTPNVFISPSVYTYPTNLISIHRVQYRCENTVVTPNEFSTWGTVRQSGNLTG